jgi:hypothetical protein
MLLNSSIFITEHLILCILRLQKRENVITKGSVLNSNSNEIITYDCFIKFFCYIRYPTNRTRASYNNIAAFNPDSIYRCFLLYRSTGNVD